ncbi:MAG: CopG family transcriptional regulator [Drouetiella hepatica Uher 2000/2452]|jgi:hypothetical protein|uniref:CopG family transcriptional regulator n=1 Tax=Drouetiella hepatica Uher 2000/2452 TaxID=904376 RepID=A0A951UPF2_9CYAN|nr:CopG family transcriptional regulator [Drouetiella hepatica Uher 2000/2452]
MTGKAMQIEIQLDEERAGKLAQIQQQTQQDATELIDRMVSEAIDQRYRELQSSDADPLAKLKNSGFIGCGKADPNLSTNYKEILKTEWAAKHGYH